MWLSRTANKAPISANDFARNGSSAELFTPDSWAVESNVEQNLGLRAAVNFAGAAQSWRGSSSLRSRLVSAVRKATIPVMFVQAENDYDLTPSRALSAELQQLGKPYKLAIFPPYGNTREEGHGGFCFGATNVWGDEVLAFLTANLGK
jgi:pimeloyl-ACP methyl ester carboxylesterase